MSRAVGAPSTMLESIWLLLCLSELEAFAHLSSTSLSVSAKGAAFIRARRLPGNAPGTDARTRLALKARFTQHASSARVRSFAILLRHGGAHEECSVFALLLGQESFNKDSDNKAPDKMNRQHE